MPTNAELKIELLRLFAPDVEAAKAAFHWIFDGAQAPLAAVGSPGSRCDGTQRADLVGVNICEEAKEPLDVESGTNQVAAGEILLGVKRGHPSEPTSAAVPIPGEQSPLPGQADDAPHVSSEAKSVMVKKRPYLGRNSWWTPDRLDNLVRMRRDGKSNADVAKIFGKTVRVIENVIWRFGLKEKIDAFRQAGDKPAGLAGRATCSKCQGDQATSRSDAPFSASAPPTSASGGISGASNIPRWGAFFDARGNVNDVGRAEMLRLFDNGESAFNLARVFGFANAAAARQSVEMFRRRMDGRGKKSGVWFEDDPRAVQSEGPLRLRAPDRQTMGGISTGQG